MGSPEIENRAFSEAQDRTKQNTIELLIPSAQETFPLSGESISRAYKRHKTVRAMVLTLKLNTDLKWALHSRREQKQNQRTWEGLGISTVTKNQ